MIVSTMITSGVALLVPFLTRVAELLFRAEPTASMTVAAAGSDPQVIVESLPQQERDALLRQAIAAGALTVTITVAPLSG